MADTKISALTALTGASVDTAADVLAIVDTSVTTTKKILIDELRIALGGSILSFVANASVADGTTNYMNSGNTSTSEADVSTPVPFACTVKNLYAGRSGGGAGTATFTLRKSGADTALTCAMSGAATTANDTSNSVTFAAGDSIDMKVVLSGGATTAVHKCMVNVLRTA